MDVDLSKCSSDGKIAYLIKPILSVLKEAGGKLERREIKNKICELDEQIAVFSEVTKTSKTTGNTYKEFTFKFNFAIQAGESRIMCTFFFNRVPPTKRLRFSFTS